VPIFDKVSEISDCYNEECDHDNTADTKNLQVLRCPADIDECELFDDLTGELANVINVLHQLTERFE
jgi:hypothetical protein